MTSPEGHTHELEPPHGYISLEAGGLARVQFPSQLLSQVTNDWVGLNSPRSVYWSAAVQVGRRYIFRLRNGRV
jgi:hypothetical protein